MLTCTTSYLVSHLGRHMLTWHPDSKDSAAAPPHIPLSSPHHPFLPHPLKTTTGKQKARQWEITDCMAKKMLQHTSVLQFRVRCWVGVLHRLCGPGLGLRDRWLWSLSHSLEGSDPEDPELECLTLPTCVCVWCCCWPDKLSVNTYKQWRGIEKCRGHTS